MPLIQLRDLGICSNCGMIPSHIGNDATGYDPPKELPPLYDGVCGHCWQKRAELLALEVIRIRDDQGTLARVRETLEQCHWYESGEGYEMSGGCWLEADTFRALFPDWPASHPHVEAKQ